MRSRGVGFQWRPVTGREHDWFRLAHGEPIHKPKRDRANLVRTFQNQASIGDGHEPARLALLESARVAVQHQHGVLLVEATITLLRLSEINRLQRRHSTVLRTEKTMRFQCSPHLLIDPVNLRPRL